MKFCLLITITLFARVSTSQSSWEIYSSNSQFPYEYFGDVIIKDDNHSYILGTTYFSASEVRPHLLKINNTGELRKKVIFEYDDFSPSQLNFLNHGIRFVEIDNENIIIINNVANDNGDSTSLMFEKLDTNLNIIKSFSYKFKSRPGLLYPSRLDNSFLINIHIKKNDPAGSDDINSYIFFRV